MEVEGGWKWREDGSGERMEVERGCKCRERMEVVRGCRWRGKRGGDRMEVERGWKWRRDGGGERIEIEEKKGEQ